MSRGAQHGSALLDALTAAALLVASVWLAVQVQLDATRRADAAAQQTQAAQLAVQKLETLRALTEVQGPPPPGEDTPAVSLPGVFVRRWHSTSDTDAALHTLSVQVAWRDRLGRAQTLERRLIVSISAHLQPRP